MPAAEMIVIRRKINTTLRKQILYMVINIKNCNRKILRVHIAPNESQAQLPV